MNEKDLKKLNRYQLLELLITQTKRADQLQARLEEAEAQLQQRELTMSQMGSIAEASLQLSGVFQAAQEAADIYLKAAQQRAKEIEDAANKKAERIIENAIVQARIFTDL